MPRSELGPSLRIDPVVHERLRLAAAERDVSMAWIANRAIREFLDRLAPGPIVLTRPEPPLCPKCGMFHYHPVALDATVPSSDQPGGTPCQSPSQIVPGP